MFTLFLIQSRLDQGQTISIGNIRNIMLTSFPHARAGKLIKRPWSLSSLEISYVKSFVRFQQVAIFQDQHLKRSFERLAAQNHLVLTVIHRQASTILRNTSRSLLLPEFNPLFSILLHNIRSTIYTRFCASITTCLNDLSYLKVVVWASRNWQRDRTLNMWRGRCKTVWAVRKVLLLIGKFAERKTSHN